MTLRREKGAPKAGATAKGADSKSVEANVPIGGVQHSPANGNGVSSGGAPAAPDGGAIFWEGPAGLERVRFARHEYRGSTFLEVRRWYAAGEDWRPTKQGVTLPLELLTGLADALLAHARDTDSGGSTAD